MALEAALAMGRTLALELGLDTSEDQRDFSHWLEQSRTNFDAAMPAIANTTNSDPLTHTFCIDVYTAVGFYRWMENRMK